MKKFDKVVYAVKTAVWGTIKPFDQLFEKYENAVIESNKPYRGRVRKQFITNAEYHELVKLGAFDDWRIEEK